MYLIILILPLISTIISGLFGNCLNRRGVALLACSSIILTWLASVFIFYEVALLKTTCLVEIGSWFTSVTYTLKWGFLFDTLTAVMLIVVTSISSLVHIYSTEYMSEDPHLPRFMAYLSFFTFFMLILVTGDNLIQMFVGWEGVGLCSYLLINFWYGRIQANKAALKAMIINRIGDFGLALAIFAIYYYFGSLNYEVIFALAPLFADVKLAFFENSIYLLDFIGFFLFIGAVGKSAQVGLHTWLPDAMEGPTPVSALIHAATMVTAGVFLLCRCSIILEYSHNVNIIIACLGGITAFLAATTGLVQNDLKRVIAYSTCSQLGYMVFAAGLSSYSVSVFHLSNHAFFKALLFLGAGSVIHAMGDEQDMRKMGGLVKILPFTYSVMFIGSLALMGFPFLTGFYSKELILEIALGSFTITGSFVYTLGTIAAFFTAYYSGRLLVLTFLQYPNGQKYSYEHAHESPFAMSLPLFLLAFCSIFIGYVSRDMFVGVGSDFWGMSLFTLSSHAYILEAEFLSFDLKLIPLTFSFLGTGLSFLLYLDPLRRQSVIGSFKLGEIRRKLIWFLSKKWLFDRIYNEWVGQHILKVAYKNTYQNIDRGLFEFLGPKGISNQLLLIFKNLNTLFLGFTYRYFLIMLGNLVFILFIFWGWPYYYAFVDYSLLIVLISIILYLFF